MLASELDYVLPEQLIARYPSPERDGARLLVVDETTNRVVHRKMIELPKLIKKALFVFNNTKVIPARLHGSKEGSGGKVEVLLCELLSKDGHSEIWRCMAASSKPFRHDQQLTFKNTLRARVVELLDGGFVILSFYLENGEAPARVLQDIGELPLPPYLGRVADDDDAARYQTVFAKEAGAVAAPTAGLHFSQRLLTLLEKEGHQTSYVTLHVGPGTFMPLRVEDLRVHTMHSESYVVPEKTVMAIEQAKADGRPVVAVGTTVARSLESAGRADGSIKSGSGRSELFIYPPYDFKVVDVLLTNFHLPRSTLLALVMAKAGKDLIRKAYAEAIKEQYRFYSYGDAMVLAAAKDLDIIND
ncbi:MAG: tRNA preQ1(34) S-adenosylmethionine ribosyltransferase-isomerase QueA [Myxococcales bacterium]|nr:MAG: tRNA preQ1(34) S-adenosylmethionine ribosyltransferase-isomerase QueA [Myxococcales bacterium]